jgi:hypothetical protein
MDLLPHIARFLGVLLLCVALWVLIVYLGSRIKVEPKIEDISPFEAHVTISGWKWIVYHCDHFSSLEVGKLVPGKHSQNAVPQNEWFLPDKPIWGGRSNGPWFFVDSSWTEGLPYSQGFATREEAIQTAAAFQSYLEDLA